MRSRSLASAGNTAISFLLDAFDGVLGSEGDTRRERQASFVSAHLLAGALGVLAWPLYWFLVGPADLAVTCAFVLLWAPLFIGLAVRQGWPLEDGQAASAFCLCGFVTVVALMTGGVASPVLPWLLVVPVEAAVSGRSKATVRAGVMAVGAFLMLAFVSLLGWVPASPLPEALSGLVAGGSLFAALLVGLLALRAFQRRGEVEAVLHMRREAVLESVTMGAPDLVTRHTPHGSVVFSSRSSERLLGIRAEALEGLSPAMFVHIQDLRALELGFQRTLQQGPQHLEVRLRRRDGAYVAVEMHTQAVNGEIVAVSRDVSGRNARIADLVIARDRAEQSADARLRFLAGVAHELRTPLNAIIGFADMMDNEVFGAVGHPKYKEYAAHIRDSGLHLVDLVSDLLDMSKIEAGKFVIERQRVEVRPLLDECVAMVSGTADAAGVKLACLAERGVYVNADRRALKQAVINLLSNAIKFTLSEGTVTVDARPSAGGIVLSVADTGVGIPEADLARIGRPFEQVAGTRSLHKGTGLGLSLVKALAELHGGRMDIASALGDGTTVTLQIPDTEPARPVVAAEDTIVFPERFRARA